ncbi:MAG: peptidoglycan-binding protein [Candidatus Thiodiazotropha sp. (ex Dulcina madagascariensis)]|nr:peptidoglycan-binding protein [Candidatus Thiodiazotropha sp. (ex Dulcina madagascariensis)]
MASLFDIALQHVLAVEGGYANDPADRGGATRFGISQTAHPTLDIERMSPEDARAIYRDDYWDRVHCDALPGRLAVALFDAAVNHGPRRAVTLLQQTLGVSVDGINGPVTQAAAHAAGADTLIDYLTSRARFYTDITLAESTQSRFLNGWLRRLFLLHTFIHDNIGDLA